MSDHLRLFADDGAETPVWSRDGQVPWAQLAITPALREALIDWQREYQDEDHPRHSRSEAEFEADGVVLAGRLAAEIGRPVKFTP